MFGYLNNCLYFCRLNQKIESLAKKKKKRKEGKTPNEGPKPKTPQYSEQSSSDSHKRDFWTGMITVLGLLAFVFSSIFEIKGENESTVPLLEQFLANQGSISGIYVNLIAFISVAYYKATESFYVSGRVYLLTLLAFVLMVFVFTLSLSIIHEEIHLCWDFLNKPCLSVLGFLAFIGTIFAVSFSKGLTGYSKEIVKK